MSGTGFLDGFKEKKGNFEPETKDKKKASAPKKEAPKQAKIFEEPVVEGTQEPKKEVKPKAKKEDQKAFVSDNWPEGDPDEGEFHPSVSSSPTLPNANPAIQRMIASARAPVPTTNYVLCGVAGPPKSGKTGGAMASRTPKEIEDGAEIWHVDFDMGGITTVAAHHSDAPGIVVLNPWVFNYSPDSRESYDFPATFQKTIDILKAAQAQTDAQRAYFNEHGKMPKPYLKTVIFDGADQWLHICETVMKIEDLELGADGIDAAVYLRQHEKGDAKKKSVSRFNWNLRTIRYQVAIHHLRELCRLGVHCYVITHMKPGYDNQGNQIAGADVPKWHNDTDGMLQQIVYTELEEERNDMGELTGVVKAYGVVVANRTSLSSPKRFLIFERNNDGGVWYGWPGIEEGDFTGGEDQ